MLWCWTSLLCVDECPYTDRQRFQILPELSPFAPSGRRRKERIFPGLCVAKKAFTEKACKTTVWYQATLAWVTTGADTLVSVWKLFVVLGQTVLISSEHARTIVTVLKWGLRITEILTGTSVNEKERRCWTIWRHSRCGCRAPWARGRKLSQRGLREQLNMLSRRQPPLQRNGTTRAGKERESLPVIASARGKRSSPHRPALIWALQLQVSFH